MKVNLEVKDISLSYGSFSITHVSFSLKGGDILGLIGRSGSGKSTIIKALLGIKKPDTGSIIFRYEDEQVPLNRFVGYSPQQNALYPYLTVEENIRTFGKLYGLSDRQITESMPPILARLNLAPHCKKKIIELSGGMQKRVDLAAAFIHNPLVVILDEPFNGLDISLQRFIWDLLRDLSKQGRTIIISSHIISDLQKNCNNFGLVENSTYYNTEQIAESIKTSREQSLELFIEKLYTQAYTSGKT